MTLSNLPCVVAKAPAATGSSCGLGGSRLVSLLLACCAACSGTGGESTAAATAVVLPAAPALTEPAQRSSGDEPGGVNPSPAPEAVLPAPVPASPVPSTAPEAVPQQSVVEVPPEEPPILQGEASPLPPAEPAGDCGIAEVEATLIKEPVDIIVVIDNSGSMSAVIRAVERNINVSFANILGQADIDYRVIMVSRYGERRQAICIEAPLSAAETCSPAPELPVSTDRFAHYSVKIDSRDSFQQILRTYRHESNSDSDRPESSGGWEGFVRQNARKVFLEFTDDEIEGMTWEEFDQALLALAPEQFGTENDRRYTWHSIVGMSAKPVPTEAWGPEEPIQEGLCGDVERPGIQYQELSRMTGGLRFPLCHTESYDTVFQRIATDVITRTEVGCDYPVPPPPPGKSHDLSKVAVAYTPEPGAPVETYAQAHDLASCQVGAFYIDGDRIHLCPDACQVLNEAPMAAVSVLFTCESTLLVRIQ